jgi:hypothetical protein
VPAAVLIAEGFENLLGHEEHVETYTVPLVNTLDPVGVGHVRVRLAKYAAWHLGYEHAHEV